MPKHQLLRNFKTSAYLTAHSLKKSFPETLKHEEKIILFHLLSKLQTSRLSV